MQCKLRVFLWKYIEEKQQLYKHPNACLNYFYIFEDCDKGDSKALFHLSHLMFLLISIDILFLVFCCVPQITKVHTFLDYVMGGCQINFTVSNKC